MKFSNWTWSKMRVTTVILKKLPQKSLARRNSKLKMLRRVSSHAEGIMLMKIRASQRQLFKVSQNTLSLRFTSRRSKIGSEWRDSSNWTLTWFACVSWDASTPTNWCRSYAHLLYTFLGSITSKYPPSTLKSSLKSRWRGRYARRREWRMRKGVEGELRHYLWLEPMSTACRSWTSWWRKTQILLRCSRRSRLNISH